MTKVNSQKYGKALLEVAQEKGQLDTVLQEVNELDQLFKADDLANFFANEVYSENVKAQVADTLIEKASEITANFLRTVRLNGRLADLGEILDETKALADNLFKIGDVEVISSVALTDAQLTKFANLAKTKFDLNDVKVINNVDSNILGGFIVNSRGKVIDASIRTQLNQIAKEIL